MSNAYAATGRAVRVDVAFTPLHDPAGGHGAARASAAADLLVELSGTRRRPNSVDARALEAARAYIAADPRAPVPARDLEHITGMDRYTLSRRFRRAFGTRPGRYRTMRQLALARDAIEYGTPLARAAADADAAEPRPPDPPLRTRVRPDPGTWALTARAIAQEEP